MHTALRDRGWILKHMKIKRLMHDPAKYLPRQRRLVATNDSNHDESLFLERSRKHEVNVPNQLWVADLTGSASLLACSRMGCPGGKPTS